MDAMVAKVIKQSETGNCNTLEGNKTNLSSIIKPCRYGEHCMRANCRFRHPSQEIGTGVLIHLFSHYDHYHNVRK